MVDDEDTVETERQEEQLVGAVSVLAIFAAFCRLINIFFGGDDHDISSDE